MIRLPVICILLIVVGCKADTSDTVNSFKTLADEVIVHEKEETFDKFETVEILKISDEDVTPLFGRLNQVRVLSDGSILAFDAATVRIHHFNLNGDFLSSFGSSGEGPGEFSDEAVIQVHNDELYVFDRLAYKIEKFTLKKSQWIHSESVSLENINDDIPWSFLKIDDDFIWMQYRHTKESEKSAPISIHHVTTLERSDSTIAKTWLATLPDIDLMFEDFGYFIASYPIPYTPQPIVNISSNNDIIIARTDEFSFLRISADTTNPDILSTLPIENIKLTSHEKQNMSGYADRIHQMVRENMPEFRPAVISRIIPDAQNGFWAGYQISDESENRWLYIDEFGSIRSETYLPDSFTPHAIFNDVFYGLEPDSNRLNAIKAYQIYGSTAN